MFYGSILDLKAVHGETQPDVLFIHANGKDRMAKLAPGASSIGCLAVIADLDVLKDLRLMQKMIESLEGEWEQVRPLAESVKKSIEASKPSLNVDEIVKGIKTELNKTQAEIRDIEELRSRVNRVFQQSSPWNAVKRAGESALQPGETTRKFQQLHRICGEMGLWIVPVGERRVLQIYWRAWPTLGAASGGEY